MALNVRVVPEARISIVKACGDISLENISGIVDKATLHSEWRSDFDVLIDMRKAGNLLPYFDFDSVPGILKVLRLARGTKHAFVVATGLQRAAGELWKPIAKTLGMNFRTFMEINKAYDWLGVRCHEIQEENS